MDEARALVAAGAREITLLGQNVNAYHGQGAGGTWSLARLIAALAEIEGLRRLRYTTSHPNDMADDLIAAHGAIDTLMPYLHLPVQSGSDRVLKAMNRRHTAESYLKVIERIRAARPDILISGDFIVASPAKPMPISKRRFELVREVRYGQCYSFKYSPRPGTPAAERPLVAPEVADERLQRLQALLTQQQREIQDQMVGRETEILIERPGRLPGQMTGKTPWLHAAHVTGAGLQPGDIVPVRITQSLPNSLTAEALGT